jgi:hypothetical protein
MEMDRTKNAIVAQMAKDAIINDPRCPGFGNGDILKRAKTWYERLKLLMRHEGPGGLKCRMDDMSFEEFACSMNSTLGVLDFWEGDVVDKVLADSSGNVSTDTCVVTGIYINYPTEGGGKASVLYTDGDTELVSWKVLRHSSIPQKILDIAKTQFMATHKCPLMEKDGEKKENENV